MIRQIPVEVFDKNFSYFLFGENGKDVAVVDPGDVSALTALISEAELVPQMILLTHSHHDHADGIVEMLEHYQVPVYAHENARGRLKIGNEGIIFVHDGDTIDLGGLKIKVLHTPGHIDDAVCYYAEDEDGPFLITGDTLFVEGCGRADLNGSNVRNLYESLQKLKALDDRVLVFPGHDYGSKPFSTIGAEKKRNKYFLCASFEEFEGLRMGR